MTEPMTTIQIPSRFCEVDLDFTAEEYDTWAEQHLSVGYPVAAYSFAAKAGLLRARQTPQPKVEVGQKRRWKVGRDEFTITAVGMKQALFIYDDDDEASASITAIEKNSEVVR